MAKLKYRKKVCVERTGSSVVLRGIIKIKKLNFHAGEAGTLPLLLTLKV